MEEGTAPEADTQTTQKTRRKNDVFGVLNSILLPGTKIVQNYSTKPNRARNLSTAFPIFVLVKFFPLPYNPPNTQTMEKKTVEMG